MDINQTYCGNHFTVYASSASLCCTLETIYSVNYILYICQFYPNFKNGRDSFMDRERTNGELRRLSSR